jgi:hypothetical protein
MFVSDVEVGKLHAFVVFAKASAYLYYGSESQSVRDTNHAVRNCDIIRRLIKVPCWKCTSADFVFDARNSVIDLPLDAFNVLICSYSVKLKIVGFVIGRKHLLHCKFAAVVFFHMFDVMGFVAFYADAKLRKVQIHQRVAAVRPLDELLSDRLDIASVEFVPNGVQNVVFVVFSLCAGKCLEQVFSLLVVDDRVFHIPHPPDYQTPDPIAIAVHGQKSAANSHKPRAHDHCENGSPAFAASSSRCQMLRIATASHTDEDWPSPAQTFVDGFQRARLVEAR